MCLMLGVLVVGFISNVREGERLPSPLLRMIEASANIVILLSRGMCVWLAVSVCSISPLYRLRKDEEIRVWVMF